MPFDTDPLTPPTSLEQLKDILSRAVRVHVKDGRYFEGTFLGVDGKRNLLLSDALESSRASKRYVGLIMVPGEHLDRFELKTLPRNDYPSHPVYNT